MHTTKDIAARLGVNAQTIRRWTDEHGAHMSPGSQISDQRIFTDDDLLVLWSTRRWRQLGYSLEEIGERLSKGERASETPPPAQTTDEAPRALMIPESVHTVALAEIKRLEADRDRLQIERDNALQNQQGDVTRLNERIAELERLLGQAEGKLIDRRPATYWLWVVVGAVLAAVLITAALLLLAGR